MVDFGTKAAALRKPESAIIAGHMVGAASGATFDNVSPIDGRLLGRVAACDVADVDAAVAAARAAFEGRAWRDLPSRVRKARMLALADLIEAHAEELALLETLDTGKPISESLAVDVPLALGTLRYYAEAIDKFYGMVAPAHPGRLSLAIHEPLGVIGAIVPWNFPLHMAMWKVAPALAMGNSVVLKPAEQSPMTAIRLGELAIEAGIPAGVLNVVPGFGATAGKALAAHMDVDMIAFTGSGAVGKLLLQYSGQSNAKRVSLELGGKSPQIVFPDCPDMEAAAQAAAWGVFYNQGEVCTAASRLLVHHDIARDFTTRVVEIARGIVPGDPLDPATRFGAMVSERQMRTVLGHIDTATRESGAPILGGARVRAESGGFYIEPTVFDTVARDAALARDEVFGPVLGIIPFTDEADAYAIASDTVFGLAAGVWTGDIDRAHRAARSLHAGLIWVNGWDACDITMPFGGFKQSGFGRDRSMLALEKFTDIKAVTFSFRQAS